MSLDFELHPHAEAELEEAVAYLEAERPGTGLDFLEIVREAIAQLCAFFPNLVR